MTVTVSVEYLLGCVVGFTIVAGLYLAVLVGRRPRAARAAVQLQAAARRASMGPGVRAFFAAQDAGLLPTVPANALEVHAPARVRCIGCDWEGTAGGAMQAHAWAERVDAPYGLHAAFVAV